MTEELKKYADIERRKGYVELGEQLDSHADRLEKRLHRFFVRALIAVAIIGIACAVSLFGFGIVLGQQKETADQLKTLVKQNQKFASDIQQQRRDSIFTSCDNQNKRHDGAVNALRKGSDEDQKNAASEAVRKEIRRRRDVTIALLDALAPVQDCNKLVKASVKGG